MARAALRRLASDPASHDRLGAKLQRIYTLARSQVGRRLWSEHRIELLAAIDIDALEADAPRLSRQLDAIRTTISDRRVAGKPRTRAS